MYATAGLRAKRLIFPHTTRLKGRGMRLTSATSSGRPSARGAAGPHGRRAGRCPAPARHRLLTSQYVQHKALVVVMYKGFQLRTSGKRTVDVESIVTVAAITGPVMNRYDVAVDQESRQQTVQHMNEVLTREVVENLADDDQIIEVVRKLSVQRDLLHTHVGEFADGIASACHSHPCKVDSEQAIKTGREQSSQLADRAAGLKGIAVSLPWQSGHREGVLATLVPFCGQSPRVRLGGVQPIEVLAGHRRARRFGVPMASRHLGPSSSHTG
jgi:hypothetical protein